MCAVRFVCAHVTRGMVGGGEVRASSAGWSPHGGVKLVWSKHITESNYRGEVLGPWDPQPEGWGGSSLTCKSGWMSSPRKDLPNTKGRMCDVGQQALILSTPHCLSSLTHSLIKKAACRGSNTL